MKKSRETLATPSNEVHRVVSESKLSWRRSSGLGLARYLCGEYQHLGIVGMADLSPTQGTPREFACRSKSWTLLVIRHVRYLPPSPSQTSAVGLDWPPSPPGRVQKPPVCILCSRQPHPSRISTQICNPSSELLGQRLFARPVLVSIACLHPTFLRPPAFIQRSFHFFVRMTVSIAS